ncbi:DUF4192 domain-containing protein [soil metagenome]
MTSHSFSDSPDFEHSSGFDDHPDLDLNRPGALIAALPAILGFTPENSLVLVSVDRGEVGAVLRVDLSADLIDELDDLVTVAAGASPEAAIVIIVDAEGALCPLCIDGHQRLCTALADSLSVHDIPLWAAHLVDQVGVGGKWHCVDGCGSRGVVDDPESSPVTVAAVYDGRRLYGRRADLRAVFEIDDPHRPPRIAAAITALQHGDVASPLDVGRSRGAVQNTLEAIERAGVGATLTDAESAVLAYGLSDVQVRDTVYALAVGEHADAAETLWVGLSRCLPEPWRAEALVQLAFCAYARSDGPLAGLALEEALQIDPAHRMAGLLDSALRYGMRPERIRELADTGYRLAQQMGVELPARRVFRRRAG